MFDVIVFGSATWDIFVLYDNFYQGKTAEDFIVKKQGPFVTKETFCLPLGIKIDISDFVFKTGGGGTNTAVGFAKQELKVLYYGTIGETLIFEKDFIIRELKSFGIVPFVFKKKQKKTNISIIFGDPKKDRTILVYRGASELLSKKDISWNRLKTKWFYLAPLSGKLIIIFKDLINFAKKNKILIAANLGNSQILLPLQILSCLLKKIDVLILNQEEACLLISRFYGNINLKTEKQIFQKLKNIAQGVIVITQGKKGVSVFDQKYIYQAKALRLPKRKIIDLTGAGDAFCSGFMSSFITEKQSLVMRDRDIIKAIQLGIANSYSCIQYWGAKQGLLRKQDFFNKVKVKKFLL